MNSLQKLAAAGQSVWLDFIQRSLIASGELKRMVVEEGLRGVTSNPAIFEKAVTSGTEYDDFLSKLNQEQILKPIDLYEALAIRDVQDAADIFAETYKKTNRLDGYVSLEVSPHLALDAKGTLAEARRLWARVNRPNVMIKVPGTPECIPVIEQLIADGININVTLLFAQELYVQTAEAFMKGLETRVRQNLEISQIASVASFFISRIDSMIDKMASQMAGKVAIANAKLTYQTHKKLYAGERWEKLAKAGAQTQRLLWASTSTKNPAYRDVLYVEQLIGPNTVNTIPPATYKMFLDHGEVKNTLEADLDQATQDMRDLSQAGVSFEQVTQSLLTDGIKLFSEPFDKMLAAIAAKHPAKNTQVANLWDEQKNNAWLGWLDVMGERGIRDVVLLGMGGSSLAPDVLHRTLGPFKNAPKFHVIDSTDPEQIAATEKQIDVKNTLFIVSSKSGSTLEPNIFMDYFFEKSKNPKNFIAITDPGSLLEKVAIEREFGAIYHGLKSIGGRYSALSNFGMVPATLMGVDTDAFLTHARAMREACKSLNAEENPGARLGLSLGQLALAGRDKVTLIAPEKLAHLGDWIEQLIAESTGKQGKGLVPVVGESVGAPDVYGSDRVFVYMHLAGDSSEEKAVERLERAGHPVIRIEIPDLIHLGAEFYRWEIATALAGKTIGINPFDQPDVEAAKVEARRLMENPTSPLAPLHPVEKGIEDLIAQIKPGDYFAIQAFVPMNAETQEILQKLRMKIRDTKKVATTLGFGPRFLHSTGQLHKGGPNTGVFLQVVSEAQKDLAIPGKSYTFQMVKRAQALGDANILKERGRRVLSISWETLCKLG
ncbi:MAG: transaldolase [Myxococcaceae bacterium]